MAAVFIFGLVRYISPSAKGGITPLKHTAIYNNVIIYQMWVRSIETAANIKFFLYIQKLLR